MADRLEGTPGRAGQTAAHAPRPKFVIMGRDGVEVGMLPPKPASAPSAAGPLPSEDALILPQMVVVRPV